MARLRIRCEVKRRRVLVIPYAFYLTPKTLFKNLHSHHLNSVSLTASISKLVIINDDSFFQPGNGFMAIDYKTR